MLRQCRELPTFYPLRPYKVGHDDHRVVVWPDPLMIAFGVIGGRDCRKRQHVITTAYLRLSRIDFDRFSFFVEGDNYLKRVGRRVRGPVDLLTRYAVYPLLSAEVTRTCVPNEAGPLLSAFELMPSSGLCLCHEANDG
jgi:hypothetical protein